MDYMTLKEASVKWESRHINYYCTQGRIPEAEKMDIVLLIFKDASKPTDRRFRAKLLEDGDKE